LFGLVAQPIPEFGLVWWHNLFPVPLSGVAVTQGCWGAAAPEGIALWQVGSLTWSVVLVSMAYATCAAAVQRQLWRRFSSSTARSFLLVARCTGSSLLGCL